MILRSGPLRRGHREPARVHRDRAAIMVNAPATRWHDFAPARLPPRTAVTSAAVIVSAHGTVEAPPSASWLGVRHSGTHSPFPPRRAPTVAQFLGIAGYTAPPVRSFRSLVMAGGIVVDRFGPF